MKIRGIEFDNITSKVANVDYYIQVRGKNGIEPKKVVGDLYTIQIKDKQLVFAVRKDTNYYNEYVASELGSGMVAVTDHKLNGLLSKLNDNEFMTNVYKVMNTDKYMQRVAEFTNMVNEMEAKENNTMEAKKSVKKSVNAKEVKEVKENNTMEVKESKAKKSAPKKSAKAKAEPKVEPKVEPKKSKVESVDTNTFKATKVKRISKALAKKSSGNEYLDKLMAEFTDCEFKLDRTWLWISGNTREHKEEFKKMGAFFTGKKMMWYVPNWLDSHPNA